MWPQLTWVRVAVETASQPPFGPFLTNASVKRLSPADAAQQSCDLLMECRPKRSCCDLFEINHTTNEAAFFMFTRVSQAAAHTHMRVRAQTDACKATDRSTPLLSSSFSSMSAAVTPVYPPHQRLPDLLPSVPLSACVCVCLCMCVCLQALWTPR